LSIFIFGKTRVHAVYQLNGFVQSGGSIMASVKNEFFWKNRTI